MVVKRTRAAAAAALLAAVGGCSSNPPSADSSKGRDLTATVGSAATAASLPTVAGGPAVGKRSAGLVPVAVFGGPAQAVGVAVSRSGRTFLSFPRWGDPVKNPLVELQPDGKLTAFPDEATNAFDATAKDADPAHHLVCVQAIVFDGQDRLWVLDPGGFNFLPPLNQGPKLWAYDIDTRQRVRAITFPNDVALKMTSLNDVRFDLSRGPEGTAYVTDSGVGGIITVDLATGASWRHLDGDPSVLPVPGLDAMTEGRPFLQQKPTGEVDAPDFRSDGIALSPDGKTLYYTSVMSRTIYAVPTDLLADRNADEQRVRSAVRVVATKPSGNDGMLCDARGRIYTADYQDNAIRRTDPATGTVEVVAQDERLIWPDTMAFHGGDLYVTVDQLPRQPNFHGGSDERQPPYTLFKLQMDGQGKDGPTR